MFELALKAGLPVIGVQTDDLFDFERVLAHLSGVKVVEFSKTAHGKSLGPYLYWTMDSSVVTSELARKFKDSGHSLILLNCSEPNPLVFDAGILPTPEPMVNALLVEMVGDSYVHDLYPAVRGLSLKSVYEVLMLTQARTGHAGVQEIRRTRASLFGSAQGLYLEDTSYDFYVWPQQLKAWLELNQEYFLKQVHPKLVPRGLLLKGPPGVGKSMAGKVLANAFSVPLYRFDVASALDKYIGVSESRVSKILSLVDREAPCVLILDEIEKVFQGKEDSGVINRILSQLLWWLAEHQSRVFTLMTTNDVSVIPPELYRPGRIDAVFDIRPLIADEAAEFSVKCFKAVVGTEPTNAQRLTITDGLQSIADSSSIHPTYPHAAVADIVYQSIKKWKWV